MKKILFILSVCFFYIPPAISFSCYNQVTGGGIASNGVTVVPVEIDSDIIKGENIFANVGEYLACKNTEPWAYIDYLELVAGGMTPGAKINHLESGAYIKSSRILSTNVPKTNVFTLTNNTLTPVDIDMFFVIPNEISNSIVIEKGDTLMTLQLYKYSTDPNTGALKGVQQNFTWVFTAANRAVLQVGSCSVNNNEPINIDFGLVPKSRIKNTGQGLDSVTKTANLNIDCENSSLNKDIKITLSANSSSGNMQNTIPTTIDNLGVEMYYNNKLIAPMDSFLTPLISGRSDAEVTFGLVKNATVENDTLYDGRFNASGSLIISLP